MLPGPQTTRCAPPPSASGATSEEAVAAAEAAGKARGEKLMESTLRLLATKDEQLQDARAKLDAATREVSEARATVRREISDAKTRLEAEREQPCRRSSRCGGTSSAKRSCSTSSGASSPCGRRRRPRRYGTTRRPRTRNGPSPAWKAHCGRRSRWRARSSREPSLDTATATARRRGLTPAADDPRRAHAAARLERRSLAWPRGGGRRGPLRI